MHIIHNDGGVTIKDIDHFDLFQTFDCGQCFRFAYEDGGWQGVACGRFIRLSQNGRDVTLHNVTRGEFEAFWRDYFDLDRDYGALIESFSADPVMAEAVRHCPGIRILRQDSFEALISFIVSQNNHIPRIRRIIAEMCRKYGREVRPEKDPGDSRGEFHNAFYAFPTPNALADADEKEMREELRCGFRAGYIIDAAEKVRAGRVNLSACRTLPLADAKAELKQIRGVGEKVASCALLFGMGRLDAFPVDVWIRRVLEQHYPGGFETSPAYGPFAGIAQQYLFYWKKNNFEKDCL